MNSLMEGAAATAAADAADAAAASSSFARCEAPKFVSSLYSFCYLLLLLLLLLVVPLLVGAI